MKSESFITSSPEETKKIALGLANSLKGGEVIFAFGEMGAGKTAFCQGLGKGLGVNKVINSPTFNLVKVYKGTSLTLYHVDCYRFEGVDDEKKDMGIDEYLGDKSSIFYVEWPIFASQEMSSFHPRITLTIEYIDEERRRITIEDERN